MALPVTLPLWGWLLLVAVPFLALQRRLQADIQAVFYLLTGRLDVALMLFAILFLPGVLLHELSHYVMANLLNVRTGRISLIPRRVGADRLRLGYVETEQVDPWREALIGAAPLLAGLGFVAAVGFGPWRLPTSLAAAGMLNLAAFLDLLAAVYRQPDFWLWFYLLFTVSSTMSPSPSDRRAWLPVVLVLALLSASLYLLGAGDWLAETLAGPLERGAQIIILLLAICLLVQAALWLPVLAARGLLAGLRRD